MIWGSIFRWHRIKEYVKKEKSTKAKQNSTWQKAENVGKPAATADAHKRAPQGHQDAKLKPSSTPAAAKNQRAGSGILAITPPLQPFTIYVRFFLLPMSFQPH